MNRPIKRKKLVHISRFEDLPSELISYILKFLEIDDLRNCSLVCSRFNCIIEKNIRILNLSICEKDHQFKNGNFFFTNKYINSSFLVESFNIGILRSNFMRPILSRIKRLFIDCHEISDFDGFEIEIFLNRFHQLEQLQLDRYGNHLIFGLNLPNLKILCFDDYFASGRIELNCPQLVTFKTIASLDNFKFIHPDKIINLSVFDYQKEINQFKNLEKLFLNDGDSLEANFNGDFFKLNELHCKQLKKKHLIQLLNCRKLMRSPFKIYLFGIKIETRKELDIFFPKRDDKICLDINTFADLRNKIILEKYQTNKTAKFLPWFSHLHYSKLIREFETTPNDFFVRCINIRSVCVDFGINQQKLMVFLKNCLLIKSLHFENVHFEDWFLIDLTIHCKYLRSVSILNEDVDAEIRPFFLELKYLDDFYYTENLPIDTISSAITQLKWLREFHFSFEYNIFEYRNYGNNNYALKLYDSDGEEEDECYFDEIEEVIDYLEKEDIEEDYLD